MNDSAISLADARPLVAGPLWPRIRAFLWNFASLCDPDRLSAAAEGGSGGAAPRSLDLLDAPRVAAGALRALGVEPVFHPFPATDASRLLLLSREDYDRLAQFLGVVALAPALRRVTAGADVRALKAALPGVYPATLAFTAYFRRHEPLFERLVPAGEAANPAVVFAAGHRLLAAALSDLPPELLLRQRLRFPAGSPADQALGADDSSLVTRRSSLAGEALAAARRALKLSNPAESAALFP